MSSKKWIFSLLTLCCLQSIGVIDSRVIDPRCEQMRIPWCSGVYDAVMFPNHVGHRTQEEAYYGMHKVWPLIQTKCSPQILHYLCRLYAPECPLTISDHDGSLSYQPEKHRPPCEDACLHVRRDCHEILWQHQIHWPDELECHNLRNKECVETPPPELAPTEGPAPPREPSPVSVPEPVPVAPEPEPVPDEATTQEPVKAEEATQLPTHIEESSEVPSVEETTHEPEETSTITTPAGDGLIEHVETTPMEEHTEAPHQEPTPAVPEPEPAPEPSAAPEPEPEPAAEEATTEAATDGEADPIAPDTTTGSLLGITPVIQEDPATPDAGAGADDGSGDEEEATTAVVEPHVEAATAVAVDAAAEPATHAPYEEEEYPTTLAVEDSATTEMSNTLEQGGNVGEILEPTVDPQATEETTMAAHDSMTSAVNGDDSNVSPRSDRATSNMANIRKSTNLGWLVIYLVTVSLIFHGRA